MEGLDIPLYEDIQGFIRDDGKEAGGYVFGRRVYFRDVKG